MAAVKSWRVPGVTVAVHDGDTATFDLDLGWFLTYRQHVRVAHINAPELATPAGKISALRVRQLLPVGTPVIIDSLGLDKYGRSLATITLPDGQDLGTIMLQENLAVPYEGHA